MKNTLEGGRVQTSSKDTAAARAGEGGHARVVVMTAERGGDGGKN